MSKRLIFVISAPSGGGKTSLMKALTQQEPLLQHVVTHTTRGIRPNEVDGLDYHFVNVEEFQHLIATQALIEWAEVYGQYYGTSTAAIEKVFHAGYSPVLNIDWQGARHIRQLYGTAAVTIFILPPSTDELQKRLEQRGDPASSIQKRLEAAQDEMNHAAEYDYVIVNDQFARALAELKDVIRSQ